MDYSEYVWKLIRLHEEEVERAGSGEADALEASLALQHSLSLVHELASSISRHSSAPELLASAPREALEEALEKTDHLIDQIVYALYGLTAEEIAIVEESLR